MAKLEKLAVEEEVKPLTSKEIAQAKLLKIIEEEKKLVKGRFRNYETPGAGARIIVKKYHEKYMPIFDKSMKDNEVYEIPLYVARHLNGTDVCAEAVNGKINSCSYIVHGFSVNPDGTMRSSGNDSGIPVPIITDKYKRRYGFESLEFGS